MSVYLTRSDPQRNLHRFYRMLIMTDLFGQAVLVREWGRIGSGGQVKRAAFATEPEAGAAMQTLLKAKLRRGYCPKVSDFPSRIS